MIVFCCPKCKMVDIGNDNEEKICMRCSIPMHSLGISSAEWNTYDNEQMKNAINACIAEQASKPVINQPKWEEDNQPIISESQTTYQRSAEAGDITSNSEYQNSDTPYETEYNYDDVVSRIASYEEENASFDIDYGRTKEELERLEYAQISMEEKIKRYHQQENELIQQERVNAIKETQNNVTLEKRSIDKITERKTKREKELANKRRIAIVVAIILTLVIVLPITIGLLSKHDPTQESVTTEKVTVDPLQQARDDVINKWKTDGGKLGTGKYIEDLYKQYPNDEVISSIYFYSESKEWYEHYKSYGDEDDLEYAIECANNIDPNYDGELSSEIKSYTSMLYSSQGLSKDEKTREEAHEVSKTKTDKYNNLTNSEKKAICEYIQSRYDYYDSIEGGNSGDKYSDTIWEEAASKYDLTESQISIIWMNYYSY